MVVRASVISCSRVAARAGDGAGARGADRILSDEAGSPDGTIPTSL